MIRALDDDQRVARRVLGRDEPRRFARAAQAADAEPAALAERVASEAAMPADDDAFRRFDGAGHGGQEGADELAKWPFPDKADASRVPLVEHG